jgi:hypothetical protein
MIYKCARCGRPLPADLTQECSVCFPLRNEQPTFSINDLGSILIPPGFYWGLSAGRQNVPDQNPDPDQEDGGGSGAPAK